MTPSGIEPATFWLEAPPRTPYIYIYTYIQLDNFENIKDFWNGRAGKSEAARPNHMPEVQSASLNTSQPTT